MNNVISALKERKGEPLFVNFPDGSTVSYLSTDSSYHPYCKYCWNSLVLVKTDEPYNKFNDREKGYCDKCNKVFIVRRINI